MNDDLSPPRKKQAGATPLIWGLAFALLVFAGSAAYLVFSLTRDAVLVRVETPPGPVIIEPTPAPGAGQGQRVDVVSPLQPAQGPLPLPWDGESRVNLLFLGMDSGDLEPGDGSPLMDTILLVTVDPQNRTAGLLSIPRDMWVEVPDFGYQKINQAYALGETNAYPGGGAGLAVDTVEELLEIPISFYALLEYNSFVRLIDLIDGVKLEIPEPIQVDPLGDHNTKTLQPGIQTLPGDLALAYVRALGESGNEFDRARRQQEVLLGIRHRIIEFEILPDLVSLAPAIHKEIAAGMRTNLNLQQVIQFVWLATRIPTENILQETIGPGELVLATSEEGLSILRPIPEEIFDLRDQLMAGHPALSPSVGESNWEAGVLEEAAVIELRNGTITPGLASQTGSLLQQNGLNVATMSNADQVYAETVIIDYAGKPYSVRWLARLLKVPQNKIFQRYDSAGETDILVVLGEDWAESNSLE